MKTVFSYNPDHAINSFGSICDLSHFKTLHFRIFGPERVNDKCIYLQQ